MPFDLGCLESLREASKSSNDNFVNALTRIKNTEIKVQGNGHIFTRSDCTFYKGLFYFYLKNYKKALEYFKESYRMK